MLSYVHAVLSAAEQDESVTSRDHAFAVLRQLGLDDFGEVLLHSPQADYPKLAGLLPSMAPAEVQNLWTGNNGYPLLRQSCNFVRSVAYNHALITGRPLAGGTVLDFGCGYGRLARLMYYFVDSDQLHGVDPWTRSIEECAAAGMGPNFALSDYLPKALPVGDRRFDLAYAFSVFTHLSRKATLAALGAVRRCMAPGGVFCITIRPVEYWDLEYSEASAEERLRMKRLHRTEGFAFAPHNLPPVEGEVTYGDTSMSFDWLARAAAGWTISRIDRSIEDGYQIYVFLRAA